MRKGLSVMWNRRERNLRERLPVNAEPPGSVTVPPLLGDLLRVRRRAIAVILAAMLVQMAASLAAPWPLKIVIDNVVGSHRPPASSR